MKYSEFYSVFKNFLDNAPIEKLDETRSYVFLSDLHMGNGGSRDDLTRHRTLLTAALGKWYLKENYILVLNGDIEDLNKFLLSDINKAWKEVLEIIGSFSDKGNLRKIIGNHDVDLLVTRNYPWKLYEGIIFKYGKRKIFVFHGHQASNLYVRFDFLSEFLVRWFLRPLHIRNISVSKNSRRRFRTEKRIYRAAKSLGILAIAGHTHRPLFESMSKYDNITLILENLIQKYVDSPQDKKRKIRTQINLYRKELISLAAEKENIKKTQSLYGAGPLLIPCLFNSGSATSKNGFNALEIRDGKISLVYWTDGKADRPYIASEALKKISVDSRFFRYTLQSERLDSIFTRIELLGDLPQENEENEEDDED
ncbi:MAG TPA: metallophosphoesterase [Treponemataceae bacterium]|nr:metallophosphoesterase [Treponemataceae bacterium]